MKTFRTGWYLIYTKPQHERKVHSHLGALKIQSLLPLTRKLREWHDRKRIVEQPLFPSYIFVYLDDLQNYYAGIDTDGALHYVRMGKEIARVNESVIKNIKLLVGHDLDLEVTGESFQAGQRVVINKSPFTGLCGEIVQYCKKHTFLIKVDLLNRNILVKLPEEYLIAGELGK
jgi:transcriptional antiterminator RfaH